MKPFRKKTAAVICALSLAASTACGAADNEPAQTTSAASSTATATAAVTTAKETTTTAVTSASTTKATTTTTAKQTSTSAKATTTAQTTTAAENSAVQTEAPADEGITPYTEIEPNRTNGAYASAVTKYTADLYRQTANNGALSGKNDLISGYSAMLAFGMAANGMGGNTLAETLDALGGIDLETLNAKTSEMMSAFSENETLNIANGMWINEGNSAAVKQSYIDKCTEQFRSDVKSEVFGEGTLDELNGWVSEKTDGMIPKVVEEFQPDQKLALINCVCFEGKWKKPFEDEMIEEGEFVNSDGSSSDVQMLKGLQECYYSNEFFEGFTRDYSDDSFYFAAMLPREGVTLEQAVNGLTAEGIEDFLYRGNSGVDVHFEIPEFTYDYDTSLVNEMEALGCIEAFDSKNGGDFSEMIEIGDITYISEALQKTHIEFDRNGTKAAAATSVAVTVTTSARETRPVKELIFDRPFMYMIVFRGDEGDIPVFIGTVNEL